MRSRWKHITALLLVLAMAISGSYAFAGTDVQPSDEGEQAVIDVTEEAAPAEDEALTDDAEAADEAVIAEENPVVAAPSLEPDAAITEDAEAGTISTMELAEEPDSIDAVTLNYTTTPIPSETELTYPASAADECAVIKVNVKTSGKLWLYAKKVGGEAPAEIYVGKYDPNTREVDNTRSNCVKLNNGESTDEIGGLDVVSGGSYCIGIESEQSGTLHVIPYVYSYATRTLLTGKTMITEGYKTSSVGKMSDSSALFLIKPSKTGYIRVFAKEYGCSSTTGTVTLLNSKKKAVSDKLALDDRTKTKYIAFGVKKGVTYYLKVSGFQGAKGQQYCYGIQYKQYAGVLRTNTTKKKARTLKRQAKYIANTMPATTVSSSHWYKFKVTKKRATQIRIDATYIKSGKVTVTVYRGKKKVGTTTLVKGKINTIKVTYSNKKGVAKKGTYYVKVTRSAKANGQYRIRYLK